MNDKYEKEFFDKLNKIFKGSVEVLSDYKGSGKPITIRYKKCGHIRTSNKASTLLSHHKCIICSGRSLSKTDILEKLDKSKYKMLGDYTNSKSKILFKCIRCGTEFYATSRVILTNREHCPKCKDDRTPSGIIKKKFGDNVDIIDDNNVKYKDCGHIVTYNSLDMAFKSNGCEICNYSDKYDYTNRLNELYSDKWEITVPNVIKNGYEFAELKCKKCGNVVKYQIKSLIRGSTICRNCNPTGSSIEDDIFNVLSSIYKGTIYRNYRFKNLNNHNYELELDFYVPEYSLGIEFDGMFWHSKLRKDKQYNKKDMFLNNYNINVIFITSYEWKYKRDIVISKINIMLHSSNVKRIPARKLYVKNVSPNIKNLFLEKYHIQGKDKSSLSVGLYTKTNKLVALLTFRKGNNFMSEWDKENNVIELSRFSSRNNVIVIGGFSKLLKYSEKMLKEMGFNFIKTFADRRYSVGNLYKECNFELDHISKENYVYFNNDIVLNRVSCQKHKLKNMFPKSYSDDKTEEEIMNENGYRRYYDCGNYVFYKEIY